MDPKVKELLLKWMEAANNHFDILYEKIEDLQETVEALRRNKADKETF